MKIVQVSHLYRPSIGGIENYSHRLVNSLSASGHDVSVITTDMSLSNDDSPLEAESHAKYCPTTTTILRNPFSLSLYRAVRNTDASVYHLHSPWYLSSLEAALALPNDTPIVMTIHGFQPLRSFLAKGLNAAYKPFAQYIFNRVDRTIVLGQSEKDRLIDEFSVSPDDVSVVPNGIHCESFDVPPGEVARIRDKHGLDPDTPTILYLSRLVPLKNPDTLVGAIADHLPDRELDVVMVGNGDPDYVESLHQRADDRITFLSNLPFDDVKALYHASDLFVLPSHMEGLPTVVLEAMNARLPIITTPVGALDNVINHREHGWLLDCPPEESQLARAVTHYLDNPEERRKVGERNREYVRAEYEWGNIATKIESVYKEVTNQINRRSVPTGQEKERPLIQPD